MSEIFRQDPSATLRALPDDQRIPRLHRAHLARLLAPNRDVHDLALDPVAPDLIAERAASLTHGTPALDRTADLVLACDWLDDGHDPAALPPLLARLLRPGGRVLAAAPNPAALDRLLPAYPHRRIWAQRPLVGSALTTDHPTAPVIIQHTDPLYGRIAAPLAHAPLLLALASDAPLDDIPDSLFIDRDLAELAHLTSRAREAASQDAALRAQLATLATQAATTRAADADWRHRLATLRVSESAARTERDAAIARLAASERDYLAVLAGYQQREAATLHDAARQTSQLRAELDQRAARTLAEINDPAWLWRRLRATLRQRARPRRRTLSPAACALHANPLFDAAWYLRTYPDVAAAGLDPAEHYLANGAAEHRHPGPDFDATWYAAQHEDLPATGLTPLAHHATQPPGTPTQPPAEAPAAPPAAAAANPAILFISGEADTPGSTYRCERYAASARDAGYTAAWSDLRHTGAAELAGVRVAILWRVRYSDHVAGIMREVRGQGGTVVFDIDDLMIRPEHARTTIIDGIRTTNAGISSTRNTFAQVQQALAASDLCFTTTEELAAHLRCFQKATYILPNGFDAATHDAARLAVRTRRNRGADATLRIGYAAGTLTHQKDFQVALPGLIHALAHRPQATLVLFRAANGTDLVVTDEFDSLAPYAHRIEWRDSVPLAALPAEIARFDINIAPLEAGNPFCECKSELKWFEAALASVPTIATPTGPFARAIDHGRTGLLASTDADWADHLLRLIDDAALRTAMGRAAYLACLHPFGPHRRATLIDAALRQIAGDPAGYTAYALSLHARPPARNHLTAFAPAETLYRTDALAQADVTIVIPCYNYADTVIEALESAAAQTMATLDLVVVDDASPDPLVPELIVQWARAHAARFNRIEILRHTTNAGLGATRNTAIAAAETPWVLPLDADNRLHPTICEQLLAAATATRAAYAYCTLQMFGADDAIFCAERYQPVRLVGGNYIDAMALVARWAWTAAGGYDTTRQITGWEDYEFWCCLAEAGHHGTWVPHILADYRVHGASMLAEQTETDTHKTRLVTEMEHRHPWLRLSSRTARARV